MSAKGDLAKAFGVPEDDPRLDQFVDRAVEKGYMPAQFAAFASGKTNKAPTRADWGDEGPPSWLVEGGGYRSPMTKRLPGQKGTTNDELLTEIAAKKKAIDDDVHWSESALRGVGQGASLGFADEITGAAEFAFSDKTYKQARDESRANFKRAQEANKGAYFAGELGGALLTAPIGGTGGGVAGAIGRGVASGAAAGAGNSEAELLDGDLRGFAGDVATGAVVGGSLGGAGATAGKLVRGIADDVTGGLGRRIRNEIAEGAEKTTHTARMWLKRSGDAIEKEIVHGPDGATVRRAYQLGATEGRKSLHPIIERLDTENQAAYEILTKAGRGNVDVPAYVQTLDVVKMAAAKDGDALLAKGIEKFQKHVAEQAQVTGGMALTQLRGLSTQAQSLAADMLNGLHKGERVAVEARLSAVVTDAINETVDKAVAGAPELAWVAKTISSNNSRLHPLLTVDKVLKLREAKEASGRSFLVRGAERISNPAALAGGVGAVYGASQGDGWEDMLSRAAKGAGVAAGAKLLPTFARGVDRLVTTGAIKAAQGKIPISATTAEKAARTATVLGTALAGRRRNKVEAAREKERQEDEERARKVKRQRIGRKKVTDARDLRE